MPLRIVEIYRSIQGEAATTGWPTAFVRTAGCDLRCRYCDEPHALDARAGRPMRVEEIVEAVERLGVERVCLTGGEPLLQRELPELVRALADRGYEVSIETGGHRSIEGIDPRARIVLDVKTPGSGMADRADLANLERLRPGDEIKFVLVDRADYEWARDLVRREKLDRRFTVHFSPAWGELDPRELARWILEDGLRVRLNVQLHKLLWGADARGV